MVGAFGVGVGAGRGQELAGQGSRGACAFDGGAT